MPAGKIVHGGIASLLIFLGNFTSTLRVLCLSESPFDRPDRYPDDWLERLAPTTPPLPLPYLDTLVISTEDTLQFLDAFKTCPLKYLTIESSANVSLAAWEAFVQSHTTIVERVTIGAWAASHGPFLPGPTLPGLCAKNGFKCVGAGIWDDAEDGEVLGTSGDGADSEFEA